MAQGFIVLDTYSQHSREDGAALNNEDGIYLILVAKK